MECATYNKLFSDNCTCFIQNSKAPLRCKQRSSIAFLLTNLLEKIGADTSVLLLLSVLDMVKDSKAERQESNFFNQLPLLCLP